ncbi:MAG: HEAT repeat domain-containing protein [Candidatus Helarchaeota archaeon]
MAEFKKLIQDLQNQDPTIIKRTLERLGELSERRAVPYLLQMLKSDFDEDLLETILWTLSQIATTKELTSLLTYPNEKVLIEVLDALGRRCAQESVEEILTFTKHTNAEIRAMAVWALGKIHVEKTYNVLLYLLKTDPDPLVRANAAWAIGKFDNIKAIPHLMTIRVQETDEAVIYNLEEALARLQEQKTQSAMDLNVIIYECPERRSECLQRELQTDVKSDQFIQVEIELVPACKIARICRIKLLKKT